VLEGPLQALHERALLACGRLDGVSALLPDRELFLYAYVRREALLSSQIEGTQSSLSDLLLAGLEHGLARLQEGFPLSSLLLREIHARLLARGRGADRLPGEFRRSQNWIGGTRPGNASFVPPPPGCTPCLCWCEPPWRTCSSKQSTPSSTATAAWAGC